MSLQLAHRVLLTRDHIRFDLAADIPPATRMTRPDFAQCLRHSMTIAQGRRRALVARSSSLLIAAGPSRKVRRRRPCVSPTCPQGSSIPG